MSDVKRYVTTCDCMSEASWGDYVRHADYARLEQECAELRDENAAHLEHIGELCAAGFFEKIGTLDQLIAERDAALKQVEILKAELLNDRS